MLIMFTHLHTHSEFSFHHGTAKINELVARAKSLGMTALALTDTDRMSGLILFYCECIEQGIKPLLGAELTDPKLPAQNVVVLAKNATGYGDLCEIITNRQMDADTFTFEKLFARQWPNLLFLSNFTQVLKTILHSPNQQNLFGELINTSDTTRTRSRDAEKFCQRLDIPLVVSNNVSFLDRDDFETHQILKAIGLNATISRLNSEEYASRGECFKNAPEMERIFPDHRDALLNTQRICDQCVVELDLNKWILPRVSVPEGYTPDSYLSTIAGTGLHERYGGKKEFQQAKKIQDMELEVIAKLGYSSYFLIVKELRDWASNRLKTDFRRPSDCTILRGSAANSITFYNIGVSDLDPIRYNLYFQRFLNEDRASPPDADLDFGWDERDDAFNFMAERWGRERVAITCTTNHFRRRAAFREIAKVFGYSEVQITEIIESFNTVSRRIEDDEVRRMLDLAGKIRGKPRFLGQHPGGLLITNDPIWRHTACEYSGGTKSRVITQIDMHNGIDELGLIKFDILGNGSLSVLRDTLAQLEEQGMPDPEVYDVDKCENNPLVRDIIKNGKTRGIFYIESPAQTRLNKKAQAGSFDEITVTSSLIRPAGTAYTKVYMERQRKFKQGIKDWDFVHPSLEPILGETHDVCAFQEDITKICHEVAGLSFKRADKIRKMMNSMHEGSITADEVAQLEDEFVTGCNHNGLTTHQALEVWQRVISFSGFSFCKSHSASYARLSFKCTWLKAHYPAQFLSSVISNNHGFYATDVYIDEARRWGIRILAMGINTSTVKYHGKHNWIRPGFMHLRAISRDGIESLVEERSRRGEFKNMVDFVERTRVRHSDIEKLVLAGAFDGFGLTRPESLFLLDDIAKTVRTTQTDLFSADQVSAASRRLHPGLTDYSLAEKCLDELRLLGFMLSANILDVLDLHPAANGAVPADRIHEYAGNRVKVFGWPITRRVHTVEKSGQPMLFLTLEDRTECMDVIFWPDQYELFGDVLTETGPFEVWGRVTEDYGTYCVEAERIRGVAWSPNMVDFTRMSERLKLSFNTEDKVEDVVLQAA